MGLGKKPVATPNICFRYQHIILPGFCILRDNIKTGKIIDGFKAGLLGSEMGVVLICQSGIARKNG